MQKRVVYNFNAQPATETATGHANGKAVKTSNAIGKIKRAFYGKGLKLAVFVVLLFASLFCAIGSADWIISQQKDVPSEKDGTKTFNVDDFGLDKYIIVPPNSTYNGNPVCAEVKDRVDGDARELPTEAKGNVKYKVIPYNKSSAQSRILRAPQNAASTERNKALAANAATSLPNEDDFKDIDYVTKLPTNAGTYAVLITSVVGVVSYGKAIKVFTIAPCPVKIEWSGAVDFIYDGADHKNNITATAKTTDGTPIDGIVTKSFTYKAQGATTSTEVTEVKNAGTYTATAEITNPNYVISSNGAAEFTVSKKELTVKAKDKTLTYGNPVPTFNETDLTYEGLLDCDIGKLGTPDFTCDYPTKNHDAGTYDINVSGLENSNYNISYVKGTLTVNQRTVTIAWGTNNSFVYNGNAQTRNYTAENVVTGDKLGLTVTLKCENIAVSSAINAGTYTATASITNKNYVIAAESETATFTITQRTVTLDWGANSFAYDGNAHTLTPTAQNVVSNDNLGLTVTVTGENLTGALAINAGTYTATAQITNANYMLAESSKIATFTITQRTLTVKAKYNEITYGEEPSANGYEISGFVNNENESVINGLENLTYIIDYAQWKDIGQFSITPKVDGLSAVNYSFKANSDGTLKVKSLNIQLSGIIEREYDGSEFLFDRNLFTAATFTAPQNPGIDLKKLPYDIYQYISNAGNAQNFDSTNGIAITPENGLFSYAFGKPIAAGSTYKIDKVTLNNKNFNLTETEVYLKYKTAKIEKPSENKTEFFTIEDALAASGDISLCGNVNTSSDSSSSDPSYVITAFAKLKNLPGTGFENYKANYEYTLSGTNGSNRKLIVPFEDSLNEKTCLMKTNATYGNVYSALVIHSDISLKLSNSASITVGAELSYNQNISCALVERHGVLSNNGIITAEDGCTVSAYGYIKGTGKIILKSGAIGNDVVSIYDFPGGTVILFNMSKVFPTNAFTLHNNACETYIYSGAKYTGFTYFVLDAPIVGNTGYESTAEIVGSNSKSGLFAPTSTSGYIIKKVTTLGNYNINDISETNQRTATNTKLQHRDNIEVYGSYKDNTMELSVSGYKFQTSTDKPFPIGLMDISIKEGELALEKSSYMVMPGSKLKVENGAKLTVNGKVNLSAIQYDTINSATGAKKYTNYFSTESDGEIIINGELTTASTAQVGGKIVSSEPNASIQLSNAMASYIMLIHTDKSNATLSGTVNAFGDIMISQNSYVKGDLNPGSYISTQGQDGNYYWITNDQLKTITFENDSTVLKTVSVVLEKSNDTLTPYIIKTEDLPDDPTKDYYTFDGWYVGDSKLIPGTTTITDNTVFTAKWIPNKYNIEYVHVGCTDEQLATITSDNPTQYTYNEKLILNTPTSTSPELNFMGWFSNKECTTPITEIAIGTHGNTTVYGKWTTEQLKKYTITYESGLKEVTLNITTDESTGFASGFTYKIPTTIKATWDGKTAVLSPDFMNSTDLQKLVEERHYNFSKYFAGWYVYATDGKTLLETIINETCPTIEKAQDIILKPIWKNKAVLQVSFKNSNGADFVNGNNTFDQKTKYFKPGCSISKVIISAACGEYTKNVCDFMGEQYQFTKYSTAQGDNADITFPSKDGAIVNITSIYIRYYYISISGENISLTGSNPYTVEPNTASFKISDKFTLSEGYEITSYTINGVDNEPDTIYFSNYDPYTNISVVVKTQLKQYTLTIVQNDYSGGVTITDSTGKRYTNGDSIYHGTNITIKTNSNTKATIVYAGNSVTIKKDKSHEIKPVTSNITITADDDSGCLVEGTLITLADGTKKKVEDLKMGDILLVYNHEKGKLDASPLLVNVHAGEEKIKTNIINLKFSDGSLLRICYEHGLFDNTLNKYVYINENNYLDYLGHSFYSASWNENEFTGKTVKLVNAYITTETVKLYNPATVWHLNLFAENMLTLSAGMTNFFEYDETMKYNEELMKADIEKYGLYTYEDFKDYVSEEVFNAFPFKYFKVSVGKGEFTFEKLLWLIEYYNDSTSLK